MNPTIENTDWLSTDHFSEVERSLMRRAILAEQLLDQRTLALQADLDYYEACLRHCRTQSADSALQSLYRTHVRHLRRLLDELTD